MRLPSSTAPPSAKYSRRSRKRESPPRAIFFQAEDGIRYYKVTGVQTCAPPIYATNFLLSTEKQPSSMIKLESHHRVPVDRKSVVSGKSVDLGGRPLIKKKK